MQKVKNDGESQKCRDSLNMSLHPVLAATKGITKELLPVYDRPVIEHIVREAIAAGITESILATSATSPRHSRVI